LMILSFQSLKMSLLVSRESRHPAPTDDTTSRHSWWVLGESHALVSDLLRLQLGDVGRQVPAPGQRPPGQFRLRLRVETADRLVQIQIGGEGVTLGRRRDDRTQLPI